MGIEAQLEGGPFDGEVCILDEERPCIYMPAPLEPQRATFPHDDIHTIPTKMEPYQYEYKLHRIAHGDVRIYRFESD